MKGITTLPAIKSEHDFKVACRTSERFFTVADALRSALFAATAAISIESLRRLPVPVRFRVSGSSRYWSKIQREMRHHEAPFFAKMADARCSPSAEREVGQFMMDVLGAVMSSRDHRRVPVWALEASIMQSFWLRQGALYEPTAALHYPMSTSAMYQATFRSRCCACLRLRCASRQNRPCATARV